MTISHTTKTVVLAILFIVFLFGLTATVHAQQDTYTTIANYGNNPTLNQVDTSNPNAYFEQLFNIFIAVVSILAVIRLMICGIQYMSSESISSKAAARTCITYVIGGLFLVLLSFLILQTINKDLTVVDFNSLGQRIQQEADWTDPGAGGFGSANPNDTFCLLGPFLCDDPTGTCDWWDPFCVDRREEQNMYCYPRRTAQGDIAQVCDVGKENCENDRQYSTTAIGPCAVKLTPVNP